MQNTNGSNINFSFYISVFLKENIYVYRDRKLAIKQFQLYHT